MRNSLLAAIVLGGTVLSANAFSQISHVPIDATPYNISIKGGVFMPIDTNLRSVDKWFGMVGAEYLFPRQIIRGSETFVELDYGFHTASSGAASIFPLTINQRFFGGPGSSLFGHEGRSYFFAGAGVTWIDPRGSAKLTFHGGIGSDLGERIFAEAAIYLGEQDQHGLRNTGVLVSIGYRF